MFHIKELSHVVPTHPPLLSIRSRASRAPGLCGGPLRRRLWYAASRIFVLWWSTISAVRWWWWFSQRARALETHVTQQHFGGGCYDWIALCWTVSIFSSFDESTRVLSTGPFWAHLSVFNYGPISDMFSDVKIQGNYSFLLPQNWVML